MYIAVEKKTKEATMSSNYVLLYQSHHSTILGSNGYFKSASIQQSCSLYYDNLYSQTVKRHFFQ